jgi:ABC-type branched-subunit amino acid transport system substrate-binding protein
VAIVALLALVGAACGRSDAPEGAESAGASPSTTSTTAGPAAPKSGDFGTLTDVCQRGAPSGAPAQGVTADAITVGTFADPGTEFRPGLNQELFDVATVFSRWCNARGGINGRKIVVDEHDARLTYVKARMADACRDDFFLVGGGAVFDQDGVESRLQCLLPDISSFAVSTKARGADLLVQAVPNPLELMGIGSFRYLAGKYPEATEHVGLLTGDISTTKAVAAQIRGVVERNLGWKLVYDDVYPAAGVTDWTPYAQKLKDARAKGLIWVGEPESLAALLRALRAIGYRLDFVRTDANHYDQNLIDTAGPALEAANVYVHTGYAPFEGASSSSPTGQYLQAFADYLPDGKKRSGLAIAAWSAWLRFARSAAGCGNDLTRRCVYDAARQVRGWTGGGMHAPADAHGCYTIERATPKGFVLMTDTRPNEGIYRCGRRNEVRIRVDPGSYTKLSDVGQSLANLK